MDVFEAIKRRGTYRGPYKTDKIPKEDIIKIVEAGILAPSGCNSQTTSFIIVDDEAVLKSMREIVLNRGMKSAACAIVVVSDLKSVYEGMSFYKEDYSAAVENIYLACTALGYGVCWVDGELRVQDRNKRLKTLLNIPSELECCVVLPIGVPKEKIVQHSKLPFNERACYNKYDL